MKLRRLLLTLCCLFALAFAVSAAMAISTYAAAQREDAAFEELSRQVNSGFFLPLPVVEQVSVPDTAGLPSASPAPVAEAGETVVDALAAACQALQGMQPDFAAWLKAEAAGIDYPVMASEDYIYRAFDGTESKSGTPFLGEGGGLDDDLFIIYAHNMKNGTMFGELDRYRQQEFRDENPGFTLTTAEGTRSYEIFAAVETRVLYENEQGLRWYGMAGSLDAAGRAELIDWLLASSLYDCGIRPGDGEQLVLLCTCSYYEANGRFLVAARRVA